MADKFFVNRKSVDRCSCGEVFFKDEWTAEQVMNTVGKERLKVAYGIPAEWKEFSEDCDCKFAGCIINGKDRMCKKIHEEISLTKCNSDCTFFEKE